MLSKLREDPHEVLMQPERRDIGFGIGAVSVLLLKKTSLV